MSPPAKASFVLIHGAWQGAWAWERVAPLLERAGHRTLALDLPGNGTDATPPGEVTLMLYADHVARSIDGIEGPVVVVGHGLGGAVAAQVSELRPDRLAVAAYLGGFLLRDGDSVLDFYERAWEDWMMGAQTRITYSRDGNLSAIDPVSAQAVFYHMAAAADAAAAARRLTPQPEGARRTRLQLSEANYGRVPRVYIETLQDCSVFPEFQTRMVAETPCAKVFRLDTDHAPQLSAPDALAAILLEIARNHAETP